MTLFLLFFLAFIDFSKGLLIVNPQFLLVEEDWPIGTHLPVTFCPRSVKIIAGDPLNYFSVVKVNESCSTLQLEKILDADKADTNSGLKGQSFSIVVAGPKKTRGTLEIQIVDVNDNAPEFFHTLSSVEIPENLEIGAEILKIQTKDPDTGISGISRFSLENSDFSEIFSLDKKKCAENQCSTRLRLAKFPSDPKYTVTIIAKDGDPHSNRTHTVRHTVTVTVKQNLSPTTSTLAPEIEPKQEKPEPKPKNAIGKAKMTPKFEQAQYEFHVFENREPTVIGEVKVLSSTPVEYTLAGENSEKFEISTSGEIQNLEKIDREEIGKFELIVKATDQSGASTKSQLTIVVDDENDNSPEFEKSHFSINIDEGKSEKVKITATDPDEGKNGQINYSIQNLENSSLPIDISNDGVLFIGSMDREKMDKKSNEVNVTVLATDSGDPPRSSSAMVTIRVKDINDNSPIFSNSRYSLVLDANISPGGVIGKVQAKDEDATSPNNYLRYSSNNPLFKITEQGELLFAGPGILKKEQVLEFQIGATDGGEPPNHGEAWVAINEHKKMLENELTTEISSKNQNESEITEISWLNSNMPGYSYEIIRATSEGFKDEQVMTWISIDRKSGRIRTQKHLDPEKVRQIKLYISMRKGKREVPVELIINVINDEEPKYSNPDVTRQFEISESATLGTTVAVVNAGMAVKKYQLTITAGPKGKLQIDDKTGEIRLIRQLDHEKKENRQISGIVEAFGKSTTTKMKFLLTISDANDNRPIFKNSSIFHVFVKEDTELGTVLDLPYPLADDVDSGNFGKLRFSMTGDEGFFKIDERNSTIRLVAPLDFETQKTHSISVKCVDNDGLEPHHEVFASITIHVEDVNDNPPIIHNTDLTNLSIEEDASPGTVVTVLVVTDADEIDKTKLHVSINSTLFHVDDTWKLVVATSLKGLAGQRVCSTISANDGPNAGTIATVTRPVCVTVYPAKNTHHNPLVLAPKPNSIHYFDENIEYEELLRVKVLQEPGQMNSTFKMDELFKKDWQNFEIGRLNGSLRARTPFDFEKKTVHEVKILACRQENCTSTHLFISVNDRNDNCPMFPKQDVRLTVLENEKGPRQVGRIPSALDSDFHSDNTKVCYTTDTPVFYFSDPTLPILYTNSSFDREHRKQHQITVTGYDCHLSCRDPHKPSNGTIVALIDVIDVNDNFPKFAQKIYSTTVVQGQISAGSHVLTVSASDLDEELDGLKFAIRGFVRSPSQTFQPSESPISIDKSTGELTATEILKDSSYSFTVVVVDGAGHEDTASVTISVVTYAQQTELVFDAPFELIMKNEKKIADNLSNATGLSTIVDKCRQNANFTLMLVHFIDNSDGRFVNVDRAVNLLMTSSEESRRQLRSVYGLREAFPPVPIPSRLPQYIVIAILLFFTTFVLSLCIWCRQRNNYERKLRHISAQASTVHTVTLGRPNQKSNPAYGEIPVAPNRPVANQLQSTEL